MASRAEYQREWRKKNPGKSTLYFNKYKEAHPEVILQSGYNWRQANKDRIAKYNSEYCKKNLQKLVTNTRNKRAIRKNIEGVHTAEDIQKLYIEQDGLCNHCHTQLIKYDVDHIIPLSRGGSNWPTNLQLLCPHCNRSKHDKTMEEWLNYKELLQING
jgi:5-methylcytosine-specific restriction endonuclease McrA